MIAQEIMAELQSMGSESIKKLLLKHGIKEPFFGVKIEHLKTIQKKVKKDYLLAKELYATGNADAMYLAGLITDDGLMTMEDLQLWAEQATSQNISEYTVPWVAAGSRFGYELATNWINSNEEHISALGWATLRDLAALKPDSELDIPALGSLFTRIEETINSSPDRVKLTMNSFIISAGSHIPALTADAIAVAKRIGKLTVNMNGTACKVPQPEEYIKKAADKGSIGIKKKTVKC